MTALPLSHLLIAIAVVLVWGSNFVVIRLGLNEFPPFLFATLRYVLAFVPFAFLLPRPDVPWRNLAAYGVFIGFGQFGMLYLAIESYIAPGLASLVVQVQIFFTLGLAAVFRGQRILPFQVAGLLLATAGISIILFHIDATTTPTGLVLVLIAAMSWAGGNWTTMKTPGVNMLAYVVWASIFAIPPLLALSLLREGPELMAHAIANADAVGWSALIWQTVGNTMFGYAAWGWLLNRHPAATVAPMALLVPVVGLGTSALFLGEPLQPWKLAAAALVLAGLAVNLLWPRLRPARA